MVTVHIQKLFIYLFIQLFSYLFNYFVIHAWLFLSIYWLQKQLGARRRDDAAVRRDGTAYQLWERTDGARGGENIVNY